ncbi:unnamed protein product [Bemisia tabaci]|uniref:UBC core domain-containing protein n=1 Tax=Bemisia tabaci TaxID=7038 RepID=A0A9P0A5P1_BEMTA|nr:unnamed protein product [Bemisia tabaci]
MADDYWQWSDDGIINIDEPVKKIVYHPTLNVLLALSSSQISVVDINSGSVLQRNSLSADEDGVLQCEYLGSHDKLLITDNYSVGVRGSYNGILFLNNFLQRPVSDVHRIIKIELLVSEAILLQQAIKSMEIVSDPDHINELLNALTVKLEENHSDQQSGVKAQKWNTVTIAMPLYAFKVVCVGIINELKRLNKSVPVLTIASIIQDQINNYLPSDDNVIDRGEMFSEAARRKTFEKWPHMNYKWALPDQMAQAGFYHQQNNKGDDCAMCFTCVVCLIYWEPADEPWSEHERHAPTCPFIKGEYTQNVPLSVSLATAPALPLPLNGVPIEVGTTSAPGLISTVSDVTGIVFVWNYMRMFKMEVRVETEALRDAAFLEIVGSLNSDRPVLSLVDVPQEQLVDLMMYMNPTTKVNIGASCVLGKLQSSCELSQNSDNCDNSAAEVIRPSLLTGVKAFPQSMPIMNCSEMSSNRSSLTTEALIKAVETLSRPGRELDLLLMFKEEKTKHQRTQLYMVIYDFHYHDPELAHRNSAQKGASKKNVSGTGTSASRLNSSTFQEIFLPKNLGQKFYEIVGNQADISCPDSLIDSLDPQVVAAHTFGSGLLPLGILPTAGGGTLSMSGGGLSFPSTSNSSASYSLKALRDPKMDGDCSSKNSENKNSSRHHKMTFIQCFPILCDQDTDNLLIKKFIPSLDGSHVLVIIAPKSFILDRPDVTSSNQGGYLLLFKVVFNGAVVKLKEQPVAVRSFNLPSSSPSDVILLPFSDKEEAARRFSSRPLGVGVILTFDGNLELFDVATLNSISKMTPKDGARFISVTYCSSKEQLCATTGDGVLHFFSLNRRESFDDPADQFYPSLPQTSSNSSQPHFKFLADLPEISSMSQLKSLYELTRFEILTPCFSAIVPPCWTELMHAVKQRRLPQLLRNSDINQYSRGWKLQTDLKTSWNDHIFEITLSRNASIGYIDVKFSLHYPCVRLPRIQFTLLKQHSSNFPKCQGASVDSFINFNIASSAHKPKWKQHTDSGPPENPVISEEFLTLHNAEILCGPVDIADCLNLSEQGGCVRFLSPELLNLNGRTLLIHIKALPDNESTATSHTPKKKDVNRPVKKKSCSKLDFCWKGKEIGRMGIKPGQTVERVASSKVVENFVGADWLHEVCVTISKTKPTSIQMRSKLQRIAMIKSSNVVQRLLDVVFNKNIVMKLMALDVLIWIACIRLGGRKQLTSKQRDFVNIIKDNLPPLMQHCFISAGRSIAHKCVKLLVICSETMKYFGDDSQSFDKSLLEALVEWLPSTPQCWSAGALHWFFSLLSQVIVLDNNAIGVRKCLMLLKQIGAQLQSRQNMHHSLIKTRYGLYNSPFESELFDLEPPVLARPLSVPVSFTCVGHIEPGACAPSTNTLSHHSIPRYSASEPIDLRQLLDLPRASSDESISISSNRLRGLTANHFMKGLLEVEPLHFTCFSASDGTKLEKIDSGNSTSNVSCLLDTWSSPSFNPVEEQKNDWGCSSDEKNGEFPWQQILTAPLQCMIVIERMHSGARRFVVLDLGATVLLTDILIPACAELLSLSIDIWIKGEDVDGQRLILATDIGSKTLIMSDIQPPPLCRYLKITTIGRYGMSMTKCKIPVGSFFGHIVVLPDETYAESCSSSAPAADELKINNQLNVLNSILENIQCRYALCCAKLKEYLNPLISVEPPNILHMHQYFNKVKEDKDYDDMEKVTAMYKRLRSLNPSKSTKAVGDSKEMLTNACIDKLCVLGESVLDLLLYIVYEIGPVSKVPQSFYNSLDQDMCENLFYQFCVNENTRIQISMCTFLLRACSYQTWWGKFLVSILTNLYSSTQKRIFPQDRVFVLLTYLAQKSIAGRNKEMRRNVIETLLMELVTLLSPLNNQEPSPGFLPVHMDLSLITWLLLYLIQCLDSVTSNSTNLKSAKGGDYTLQRKLSTADNINSARHCRRKLHKKLMQHKQQLEDLEVAKEAFQASTQAASALCNQANKLSIRIKFKGQLLKKQMKASSQSGKSSSQPSVSGSIDDLQVNGASCANLFKKSETNNHSFCLPVAHCLPVARALIKFLLYMDLTVNIDLFLLTCNVLARIVEVARSCVSLGELFNQNMLLKLIKIATNAGQHRPWATHAITCLLQDLLQNATKTMCCAEIIPEPAVNTSNDNTRLLDDIDEEDVVDAGPASSSNKLSADRVLPPLVTIESDDSDFEEFLESLNKEKEAAKKVFTIKSPITVNSSSISTAMDSRLEFSMDSNTETSLQRMTVQNAYNLPISVHTPILVSEEVAKLIEPVQWDESITSLWHPPVHPPGPVPRSAQLFTACFDHLLSVSSPQPIGNLELILQLWLSLSADGNDGETSTIPLSPTAISGLMKQFSWHPTFTLRVWCLAFQAITLAMSLPGSSETDPLFENSTVPEPVKSMTNVIINSPNLITMLHSFLSSPHFSMVGTSVCLALQKMLIRLEMHCDVESEESELGIALKNMMLRLVLLLVTPLTGAIPSRRGPLDAQNSLIQLMIHLNFSNTDLSTAMNIVESVASLLHAYVPSTKMMQHNNPAQCTYSSMSTEFGVLINHITNLDTGELKQNKIPSYENLLVNLLELTAKLIKTRLNKESQQKAKRDEQNSSSLSTEDAMQMNSQTDDHKIAEEQGQLSSPRSTQAQQNKVPCLADVVMQHESTVLHLMQALCGCGGAPFTLLGLTPYFDPIITLLENSDPFSVADALFQLTTTLVENTSLPTFFLRHLMSYLSGNMAEPSVQLYRLSEPLLCLFLRALKTSESVEEFEKLGGFRLICSHLVASSGHLINAHPSTVSLVMQHLTHPPVHTWNLPNKKLALSALETEHLLNFAPLGTITCSNFSASHSPDVLIHANPPHRRARTPAWSYNFYPDEVSIDLILTLPCAVLIHEVHLQPHLSSLAMCPSSVGIEIGTSNSGWFIPVSVPIETSGRMFIRLALPQPEVASVVLLRLYRPKESNNIGLTQIKLLGTTSTSTSNVSSSSDGKCEDDITKSSFVGWLCLLHHCLEVCKDKTETRQQVMSAIANCPGVVEACCSLFLTRNINSDPPLYTPYLQNVLLSLGLHSREIGLLEINVLLHNASAVFLQGGFTVESQCFSSIELLFLLCTKEDKYVEERITALITWLQCIISNSDDVAQSLYPFVHCVAAVLWASKSILNNLCEGGKSDHNKIVTPQLFSLLYEWGSKLSPHSALKKAVDSILCAMCFVDPSLFNTFLTQIGLLPALNLLKTCQGQKNNDSKNRSAGSEQVPLTISEADLMSLAVVCQSPPIIEHLINYGLPSLLVDNIVDFCKGSSFQAGTVKIDEPPSSAKETPLSDSDKFSNRKQVISLIPAENNSYRVEAVSLFLWFFGELCSEGCMRDWLGSNEGSIFWQPLLELLSNRTHDSDSEKCLQLNESWSKLEDNTVKFFSRCCWGHLRNQEIFAHVLCAVINSQNSVNSSGKLHHGLPGFTRRLILQLLLESEKIFVSVNITPPLTQSFTATLMNPIHPSRGICRGHQFLYVSTQSRMVEIINMVSIPGSLDYIINEVNKVRVNSNSEMSWWEALNQLSIAAAVTAKDKRSKEAKNIVTALSGPQGKSRPSTPFSDISLPLFGKPHAVLEHPALSGPLDPLTTISQVMATLSSQGFSLSAPIIEFNAKENTSITQKDVMLDIETEGIPSPLQIFSQIGGLALLAEHLPLVYPEPQQSTPSSAVSPFSPPPQLESEWVKVDATDDIYMEIDYSCNNNSAQGAAPGKPVETVAVIPAHSLAAFGLFLRLPGYSDVLLRSKKNAQCLLRLVLGVTDDGEGGDILNSPLANNLPTLPFEVLEELLSLSPLTSDEGIYIRQAALDLGVVHLILACLAALTHFPQYIHLPGIHHQLLTTATRAANEVSANARADKQLLYWAKGTGFGTGSTAQSWNVEQALSRQKCEESHITVLIEVLSSFINPKSLSLASVHSADDEKSANSSDEPPERLAPGLAPLFYQLLEQSCLLPALSSYLRNDSVLDMARHIPLYRAILCLLRVIASNEQYVELLFPRSSSHKDPSISSLLLNMKKCVDNYSANVRDKINKTKQQRKAGRSGIMKLPTPVAEESLDQDEEGLASLIPDIQSTALLIQVAMDKLIKNGDSSNSASSSDMVIETLEHPLKKTVEERYLEFMKALQFDMYDMIVENCDNNGIQFTVSHHFESVIRSHGDRSHPSRVKRLAQEAVTLSTSLPLSYSSSVFVRCDSDRLDVMKVLITGPAETPYMNGCFEFDVYFPKDYPTSPMLINLETTGQHTVRFNPNLYNDGKVCLSVLNTWHGRPEEKWNAQTSSFLQVLVSIQSLILVPEPYFNEPGYERSRGTPAGTQSSREYNINICQATLKWAMVEQLKNPSPCFKTVIQSHFWIKRNEIFLQIEKWIAEVESDEYQTEKTIAATIMSLKRLFRLLCEEIAKLTPPPGLEDLNEGVLGKCMPTSNQSHGSRSSSQSQPSGSSASASVSSQQQPTLSSTTPLNSSLSDFVTDAEMEMLVSKVVD